MVQFAAFFLLLGPPDEIVTRRQRWEIPADSSDAQHRIPRLVLINHKESYEPPGRRVVDRRGYNMPIDLPERMSLTSHKDDFRSKPLDGRDCVPLVSQVSRCPNI